MELHYNITQQDFVDFNLYYFDHNASVQRSIMITRVATAAIVIVGGAVLMALLGSLSLVPVIVYLVLAALFFFGTPWYMRRKVIKNTGRILRDAQNKQLCGPKTFLLHKDEFQLKGGNEDTSYPYEIVQRIVEDENHYYIFIGDRSGLIIPFSAFKDKDQKADFYGRMTAHMHTPDQTH